MAFSSFDLIVPDIEKTYLNYSTKSVKNSNIAMLKRIKSQYGVIISKYAKIFKIDSGIIIAFIATESGGNQNIKNASFPDIKGLMQISPAGVFDTITKWRAESSEPLPPQVVASIRIKIPELLQKGVKYTSQLKSKIVRLTGTDVDFNIMTGVALLRWLIERFSSPIFGGQLNKAMVAYNAGAYTKSLGGINPDVSPIDSAILAQNVKVPLESRNYLLKMFGIDGFLSLIYKDKVI
jgi:hypothetical protein